MLGSLIFLMKLWKLDPPRGSLRESTLPAQPVIQEGQTQWETEEAGTTGEKERQAAKTFVSSASGYSQHLDQALLGPGSPEITEETREESK